MPPLPTIPGIHRVAFQWHSSGSGATAVNVMHFHGASTDTLALKNLLDASVTAGMWTHTLNAASIFQLAITPLDGTSGTDIYTVSGTKWTGGTASTDFVPQVAAIVSLRTAERGRRRRGRVFLPFIGEQYIANGSITTAVSTAQGAWDAFLAAMTTGSYPLHIASYGHSYHKSGGHGSPITYTPYTWPPDSRPVTRATYETLLGTMRPRQSRLRA